MISSKKAMTKWLAEASSVQIKTLAKGAGTSVQHLHHIAGGRRKVGADLAQRLAQASMELPRSLRIDARQLCVTCATCPLANRRHTPKAA